MNSPNEDDHHRSPGPLYYLFLAGVLIFVVVYCAYTLAHPRIVPPDESSAATGWSSSYTFRAE